MTAQGYFDEDGRWLQRSQLSGLDVDGNVLELRPSTLGVTQIAVAVDPSELLRYTTVAIYLLEAIGVDGVLDARLGAGEVFRFGFNYGSDFHLETAFLIKNADGYFCLVGTPMLPIWSEPGRVELAASSEETSDDLDFEMF
jgi:hypothetical protein